MDTAVGLVQSYLYMNGYFTVTEYPVLELIADCEYRTVTDVDILALRIPGAGRTTESPDGAVLAVDPALDIDPDRVDVQRIAEVRCVHVGEVVARFVVPDFGEFVAGYEWVDQ